MKHAMRSPLLVLVLATAVPFAWAADLRAAAGTVANPIRKVVTMLQSMSAKVEKEGEAEKELYEKFMCYCKTGGSDLAASISAAEDKSPELSSEIEASEGRLAQLKGDIKEAQTDRSAAKDAMAQATSVREKEAAAFADEKTKLEADIEATTNAVTALEKGAGGSFLQTQAAQVLRHLVLSGQEMLDGDRQELSSFLQGTQSSDYAPQSGQITGILKQMGDTMAQSLAEATATEETAIKTYEQLMASKTKEVKVLGASIETKTEQVGELGVKIVQLKEDLSDTAASLAEDKKFLAGLEKSCSTKTAEWEARQKTRAEELVALADTIKVLNDDDALELFKKTLPSASASFVQVEASAASLRVRALAIVRSARQKAGAHGHAGLDFLVLALSGRRAISQGTFDKVIKMCDDMVEVLKKEQSDDDAKKEYCAIQFDQMDDKKKELEQAISDKENAIADAKEGVATLTEEMKALEEGIVALDKSVAEATDQRKQENVEFKDLMASNTAAKKLLGFAKNRLNKFYNPKLYKPPPKKELSEADRINANMGGAVFAQISAHMHRKDAPGPPPETWGAYQKKSENTGVMAMIDLLVKDLDKEMTEAEVEEKDAQADYEEMMKKSAEKRTLDTKALTEKESARADLQGTIEADNEVKADTTKELMATLKYIQSLHTECDWLLKYFDMRKEARADEMDAVKKAKAVLNGADYSLVQTRTRAFLKRSG